MKIGGACHCGAIAYEAQIDPAEVTICHCDDCQRLTGSAYRVAVATDDFRLIRGTPKTYLKTADSGRSRLQAFCGDCGSPIHATDADGTSGIHAIRVGTIDQRAQLWPGRQIWCRSALPWTASLETLPRSAGEPDG